MSVSRKEVLMGRDVEFPLSPLLEENLTHLLAALNQFRAIYAKPLRISSGYRPGRYNKAAKGALRSAHATCEACDFVDKDGSLDDYCVNNIHILEQCGLYLEDPSSTKNWCHLSIRPPASGLRIFKP